MQDKIDNTTIALAGMLQAVALLRELTQTGKTNEAAFAASIYSIFQTDPSNLVDVYQGLQGVKLGLEKIIHNFQASHALDRLQSRYLLSLISQQRKLMRSPKMLEKITERLKQTRKQVDYFSLTHPTVIANLADIYLTTLSTFKFRILIVGNKHVLNVRENMDKVRALLLAGVRSTVLWRQMGGSRLQFLFARHKIKASAEKLLAQLELNSFAEKDTP